MIPSTTASATSLPLRLIIPFVGLLRWTLHTIISVPLLLWLCVVANLAGALFGGILWYGPMLWQSPLWAVPFIPDCPLSALLGTIALLGIWQQQRWRIFNAITSFACMLYGIWTMGFWLREWSISFTIAPIEFVLFVTHIGLFIEGLLFVPQSIPLSVPKRLLVIGWFVMSLVVDYGLGYYPPLTLFVTKQFVFWLATITTTVLSIGLLALPYHSNTPSPRFPVTHS